MIYQVKVFNPKGKLKRIDSAKKCQEDYWKQFGKSNPYRKGNGPESRQRKPERKVKNEI